MTFRTIDVTREVPRALAEQPAPQLAWVEVAQLVIDDRYQRPLNPGNWAAIRRIAENFRWSRFSPVLLAPIEGGRFAVIDGQHRCHAAAMCGIQSVPAMIVHIPTAEQAAAFAGVNASSIRISAFHILKAALAAREPWAERCEALVDSAGCRLMTYYKSAREKQPGEVYCVTLVRTLINRGHAEALRAVLHALRQCQHGGDVFVYTDAVVDPLVSAVAAVPHTIGADLVAFLDANPPSRLIADVHHQRAQMRGVVTTAREMCRDEWRRRLVAFFPRAAA